MSAPSPSLFDILVPPANPWLSTLHKRETPPTGVQVVRFSEDDDEEPKALRTDSSKRR